MKKIALCEFDPTKYGQLMSVDVVDIESFRDYLWENPVYGTNYYSIYLITHSTEMLEVDGKSVPARPGMIVCSRPGELWRWEEQSRQEGEYLYWTDDFLNSFFRDPHFIDSFTFFKQDVQALFFIPMPGYSEGCWLFSARCGKKLPVKS